MIFSGKRRRTRATTRPTAIGIELRRLAEGRPSLNSASSDESSDDSQSSQKFEPENKHAIDQVEEGTSVPETAPEPENKQDVDQVEEGASVPEAAPEHELPEPRNKRTIDQVNEGESVPEAAPEHELPEPRNKRTIDQVNEGESVPEAAPEHELPEPRNKRTIDQVNEGESVPEAAPEHELPEPRNKRTIDQVNEEESVPEAAPEHELPEPRNKRAIDQVNEEESVPQAAPQHNIPDVALRPARSQNVTDSYPGGGAINAEFEVNFLRFVDKMTNGARIVPSETGTSVLYQPGILIGGIVKHECCLDRGVGYILEAAMELAPFCKTPLELTLGGVTSNEIDPSVDRIKDSGVPVLKRFMTGDYEVILTINKRGAVPDGGGEVFFKCSTVKSLKTIQLKDSGLVKRIRGIAYGVRVSPGIPHRMIETAKGSLLKFIPDVYINIDEKKGKSGGKSPGYGITLTAETINGIFYSGEAVSPIRDPNAAPCFPQDLGKEAANKLFDEIYRNGTVDSPFQSMTALFMAFSGRDVSKVVVGPFTPAMIQFLRDLKVFTGVTFRLANVTDDEGNQLQQVHMTCSGIGFSNMSRRAI
ncbi:unnamed protein product [Trichogramma brassicae]|uniref:RNA 3'-terminal phosphate cyclase domain-containing protein n=1 Tax=Trichogramma brassicae TaxID=86971 RepID=A0A6H5HY76_9HYME|nr:unnamed protein product [Trichogramma brassicae]